MQNENKPVVTFPGFLKWYFFLLGGLHHSTRRHSTVQWSIGFGGFSRGRWFPSAWPSEFRSLGTESRSPSSAFHELYPIVTAAILWRHEWWRKSILIHSNNTAVVKILNKGCSRSPVIAKFLCRLTLILAQHQFILGEAHIPGHYNSIADSLSHVSFQKFRNLAPELDFHSIPVPSFSATTFN